MYREPWRRWIRTVVAREWNLGKREAGGWNWSHEDAKQRNIFSSIFLDYNRGSRCLVGIPGRNSWKSLQNSTRLQVPDPNAPPQPDKPERRINRAIVSRTIRLVNNEGHKILTRMEALKHAEYMDLDLVEIDGKQDPPVCKLMDYNKERFKERQREKGLKKKQSERRRLDDLKEVRFSTRTEQNDLELKAQMALRLLNKGHRVKDSMQNLCASTVAPSMLPLHALKLNWTMTIKPLIHPLSVIPHGNDDLEPKGRELIDRMVALLRDSSKVETGPRIERQRAWVLIRPTPVGTRDTSKQGKEGKESGKRSDEISTSDSEESETS